jgi:hypothetical protein
MTYFFETPPIHDMQYRSSRFPVHSRPCSHPSEVITHILRLQSAFRIGLQVDINSLHIRFLPTVESLKYATQNNGAFCIGLQVDIYSLRIRFLNTEQRLNRLENLFSGDSMQITQSLLVLNLMLCIVQIIMKNSSVN